MKKKICLFILLFLFILNSNAQKGTKENLKPFLTELKAPDFLKLLERSKQKTKKDSTEIIVFHGFSDYNTQKCSFTVYKFRKSYMLYGYKHQDSISSTYYVYQNQKIIYKEAWSKRNKERLDIDYYKNGKPRALFSKSKKTYWYFDRDGNIYDNYYWDVENPIEFDFNKYNFTREEQNKIREDLRKIALNFDDSQGFDWKRYSIKDWKALNMTKEYLKKLFNTDVDLYYEGMSQNFISIISEYGKFYTIEDCRVIELGKYDNE